MTASELKLQVEDPAMEDLLEVLEMTKMSLSLMMQALMSLF